MQFAKKESGRDINGYVPARVVEGAKWYVEFYAYDPDAGRQCRKRMYVPQVRGKAARRAYADEMAASLNQRLRQGWNPFLRLSNPREYTPFADVCRTYLEALTRMTQEKLCRKSTSDVYASFLRKLMEWTASQPKPVTYVYQLKQEVVVTFLDHLWLEEKLAAKTRDNYLSWLRSFSAWMIEKHYAAEDPTAGISFLQGHRKVQKNRTVIPKEVMVRLRGYLLEHDRYFLLACFVLYYCFIRPREMSFLKVGDVSVKRGTISIGGEEAKNGKDAVVTVPDSVMRYMIELRVLEAPADWYLFSKDFAPGPEYRRPRQFCDAWKAMSSALKLPAEYKFYSLKDTGITDLIKDGTDLLAVRDQARHYSLEMTDLYTPMASRDANRDIKARKSYF